MVSSDKNVPCVVGSILNNVECSARNQSITTEEETVDGEELSKHDAKGHKVSHEEITENTALKNENSGAPKPPYPVVTMDARSLNKTAALIRMVVQAHASNGAKLPKSGQAKSSQVNTPGKREPSNGHVLDVLRRLNSVVNSYQPEYSQKGDLRKSERRYVITNFDVIDSYIKSRRQEKKPSADHEWPIRRSDKADKVDQTSEGLSAEEESDKNSNAVTDAEDKLDYEDKSDDYIITTKRNVWDYEHEQWADIKRVNWDDVHSSKDTSGEGKTIKGKDDKLKITIENFVNHSNGKAKDKVVVTKKNDQGAEDSVAKIVIPLNDKSESKTIKADTHEYGQAVKKNLKKKDSQIEENISSSEKHSVTERSSNIRLEVTKNTKEQNRKGTIKGNEYFKSEADRYRADRSNKSPNLNKADNWQKDNDKMDELDELDTKDKAGDKTYKNPVRRGKLNGNDYNDRKIEEKSKLSEKSNQRIYKNSKEDQENDGDKFKKRTKDKDYADNVQKKKGGKESLYGDYKDSYDYRDKKKKKQGYNDKKLDDYYKDTKKRSSDYKDYYGGKENKKKPKNQDYADKKFDNDYKNADNKDYKDDYGKNKKRERNLDDDYKNSKDKNTDYNMDNDKKDKKKNNDWEIKTKGNWPEERNDNKDGFKNKKSNIDDWDSPINSREKTSAKSSDKGYNKKKKDELDYNNPENKNKNDPFDKHANNNWDNVGIEKKSGNSDRFEMTTRRTTKRYIDDYEKPARKPKDYDEMDTYKDKFDKTTKRFDRNDNNNWDSIGRTKRKRLDVDSYVEKPRGKSRGQRGGGDRSSGGFNNHVHTPLPMRERKSVYESD